MFNNFFFLLSFIDEFTPIDILHLTWPQKASQLHLLPSIIIHFLRVIQYVPEYNIDKKIIKSVLVHFLQIKLIFFGRKNYSSSFFRFSYYKSITFLFEAFFIQTICLATYLKFDNIFCHYQFFPIFFFSFGKKWFPTFNFPVQS